MGSRGLPTGPTGGPVKGRPFIVGIVEIVEIGQSRHARDGHRGSGRTVPPPVASRSAAHCVFTVMMTSVHGTGERAGGLFVTIAQRSLSSAALAPHTLAGRDPCRGCPARARKPRPRKPPPHGGAWRVRGGAGDWPPRERRGRSGRLAARIPSQEDPDRQPARPPAQYAGLLSSRSLLAARPLPYRPAPVPGFGRPVHTT